MLRVAVYLRGVYFSHRESWIFPWADTKVPKVRLLRVAVVRGLSTEAAVSVSHLSLYSALRIVVPEHKFLGICKAFQQPLGRKPLHQLLAF